jgi:hypothetical protein
MSGLPSDVWRLILDQVGDSTIFIASMCSKSWKELTKSTCDCREEYLTGATKLHPTLFPDATHSSRKKLALIEQAIDNMKSGRVIVTPLTKNPEEPSPDRSYLILHDIATLQDGGNLIMLSSDVHNRPLDDGEEEQPASCCSTIVDISSFPEMKSKDQCSVERAVNYLCGPEGYVFKREGAYRGRMTHVDARGQTQLQELKALFPDYPPWQFEEYFRFNGSAEYPLLVVAPFDEDPDQTIRAGSLMTKQALETRHTVPDHRQIAAFSGAWVLFKGKPGLLNLYSGETLRLKDSIFYMIDSHRLVALNPKSGVLRFADLRDDSTSSEIKSQLSKQKFKVPGLDGSIACVSGRVVVVSCWAKHRFPKPPGSEKAAEDAARVVFVDLTPSGATVIGVIQAIHDSDKIEDVQAVDSTLFVVRRQHNAEIIDLLARGPCKQDSYFINPNKADPARLHGLKWRPSLSLK